MVMVCRAPRRTPAEVACPGSGSLSCAGLQLWTALTEEAVANSTDADLEPAYPRIFTDSEENTGTSEDGIGSLRADLNERSSCGSVGTDETMSPPLKGITSQLEAVNEFGAPALEIELCCGQGGGGSCDTDQ